VSVDGFYNRYQNYIYGVRDPNLGGVTPGSLGMKVWTNLPVALFCGSELQAAYQIHRSWVIKSNFNYVYAVQSNQTPISMIAPFSWGVIPEYKTGNWTWGAKLAGQSVQSRIDPFFGEDATPSWATLDLKTHWIFIKNEKWKAEWTAEISNVFDARYHTHLDWGNIPRMGRSFNMSLIVGYRAKKKANYYQNPSQPK
jgi:iron complex outermembrane receptor protein